MYRLSEAELIRECFLDYVKEQREKLKYLVHNEVLPDATAQSESTESELTDSELTESDNENVPEVATKSKYFDAKLDSKNDGPSQPFRPLLPKRPPLILKLKKQHVEEYGMETSETEKELEKNITKWMILERLDKEKQEKKK